MKYVGANVPVFAPRPSNQSGDTVGIVIWRIQATWRIKSALICDHYRLAGDEVRCSNNGISTVLNTKCIGCVQAAGPPEPGHCRCPDINWNIVDIDDEPRPPVIGVVVVVDTHLKLRRPLRYDKHTGACANRQWLDHRAVVIRERSK